MLSDVMPYVLLMNFFCAFIGVFLGSHSGKSAEGFALGFLFGPLGLIIAVLLKPTPKAAAHYQLMVESARRQLLNQDQALAEKAAEIAKAKRDRAAAEVEKKLPAGPTVDCPTCREQIPHPGSAKFIDCPNCGQRVKS